MEKIRVLIADDHAVVRAGLRLLIDSQSDMEVAAEVADGHDTLGQIKQCRPDVVLLDLSMPGMNGLTVLQQMTRSTSPPRALVLTMYEDPDYLRSVLAAGGDGYVVKRSADSHLLEAIRAVFRGEKFLDPSLGEALVADVRRQLDTPPGGPALDSRPKLSPREEEVLAYLAHGFTNQEIAEKIAISVKSVETYRGRLLQKLGFKSRAELVRYAIARGILPKDDALNPMRK